MTNEWVKHGDKVCIDSGSDAWRGMVAAGAIAGEGAAPVERLENLDVLRKVKKLWGPMDDYFMQAHGGLFLLSGAIGRRHCRSKICANRKLQANG